MTQTAKETATATGSQATATLPQAIAAATQIAQPDGYTLITLGFKSALNYNFVVSNPISSAQIFAFLPDMLATPFESTYQNISVLQLVPLQSKSTNYLATVAEVYFPTSEISTLSALISNSTSPLYTVNDGPAKYLAYLIDQTIPLTGLLPTDGTISGSGSNSSASQSGAGGSNSANSEGDPESGALGSYFRSTDNDGKGISSSKPKIIGLVIGVVVGGCTYIALMILLIRYFVVKRQAAKESAKFAEELSDSSSESGSDRFSQGQEKAVINDQESITPSMRINNWMNESHYYDVAGPDVNVAQIGKKATTVPKISRPIASQNSLGWNEV